MSSDDVKRDAVEQIIQETALWGYQVAKAGGPFLKPTIRWNDDGSFGGIEAAAVHQHEFKQHRDGKPKWCECGAWLRQRTEVVEGEPIPDRLGGRDV